MDLDAFESPKLLLAGAKVSLALFEAQAAIFAQTCRHTLVQRPNQKTGGTTVVLCLQDKLSDSARIAAYRIVTDIRSALDQATGDAAIELGRANSKGVYFPMGRDPSDFEGQVRRHCRGVHAELISFIERLKPYYGGNSELWALGRMAGPNKHQRILAVGFQSENITIHGYPWALATLKGPATLTQHWDGKNNELEVMQIGPGGHLNAHIRPSLEVTIGEAEVFKGKPAAATFHQLIGIVEGIVLGLEAETARIKAAAP